MASGTFSTYEEDIDDHDLRYDGSLGISELLQEKIYSEELQSLFPEGCNYEEMLRDVMDLERSEGIVPWEESASEDIMVFLKQFHEQRKEIEKCIQCLKDMADNIDETHKNCTIANMAANSTSLASGILTILGLTLAPLTAGGSLALTATGIGLGAAAAATSISVSIYENVSNSKERSKANDLLVECQSNLKTLTLPDEVDFRPKFSPKSEAMGDHLKHVLSTASKIPEVVYKSVKGIRTNVRAFKVVKANPGLKALAQRLTAAGSAARNSAKGTKQVQKALAGTTLAMSKGARVLGATAAGVFVMFDAYSLVKDSIHLTEGAKAEAAADIREKASQLEKDLQNLSELYEELKGMVYE
ncbi:apolipoprotein L3 [Chelydra serpentina]|uniref:Apolipoprotein L3 n=1 Tax=Chelydra serpentina TaxID=8475 RepID=A0A8T1SAS8_CHESE|nr:apolipoprotein L3 [Chelydra serpentina]